MIVADVASSRSRTPFDCSAPGGDLQAVADPLFIDKVRDVVGLYLDPPETRDRALRRREDPRSRRWTGPQPVLPMMPGVPERRTHDYVRHGATSLFAALDIATGQVISSLHRRHRSTEFRKFLDQDRQTGTGRPGRAPDLDNYATHKTAVDPELAARHPRFHLHFTPTGSSWLNLVERWFAELTDQVLRRGVHTSVQASKPISATGSTTGTTNPSPFIWTKTADEILESLADIVNESLAQDTRPRGRQIPFPNRCWLRRGRPDH